MMMTGMLRTNEINVTDTMSAFGKADRAQNRLNASVAPTGAEKTALKIVASTAEASRTSPVLLRTNSWLPPAPLLDATVPTSSTAGPRSAVHLAHAWLDTRRETRR